MIYVTKGQPIELLELNPKSLTGFWEGLGSSICF